MRQMTDPARKRYTGRRFYTEAAPQEQGPLQSGGGGRP